MHPARLILSRVRGVFFQQLKNGIHHGQTQPRSSSISHTRTFSTRHNTPRINNLITSLTSKTDNITRILSRSAISRSEKRHLSTSRSTTSTVYKRTSTLRDDYKGLEETELKKALQKRSYQEYKSRTRHLKKGKNGWTLTRDEINYYGIHRANEQKKSMIHNKIITLIRQHKPVVVVNTIGALGVGSYLVYLYLSRQYIYRYIDDHPDLPPNWDPESVRPTYQEWWSMQGQTAWQLLSSLFTAHALSPSQDTHPRMQHRRTQMTEAQKDGEEGLFPGIKRLPFNHIPESGILEDGPQEIGELTREYDLNFDDPEGFDETFIGVNELAPDETGHFSPFEDGGWKDIDELRDSDDLDFGDTELPPQPVHFRNMDDLKRFPLDDIITMISSIPLELRKELVQHAKSLNQTDPDNPNAARPVIPPLVMEEVLNNISLKNLHKTHINPDTGLYDENGYIYDDDYTDPLMDNIVIIQDGRPLLIPGLPRAYESLLQNKRVNGQYVEYIDSIPNMDLVKFRRSNAYQQTKTILELILRGNLPTVNTTEPVTKHTYLPVMEQDVVEHHPQRHENIAVSGRSMSLLGTGARSMLGLTWIPMATAYSIGVYIDSPIFLQQYTKILPFYNAVCKHNESIKESYSDVDEKSLHANKIIRQHTHDPLLLSKEIKNKITVPLHEDKIQDDIENKDTLLPGQVPSVELPSMQEVWQQSPSKSLVLTFAQETTGKHLAHGFERSFASRLCDGRQSSTWYGSRYVDYDDGGIDIPLTPVTIGLHNFLVKRRLALKEIQHKKDILQDILPEYYNDALEVLEEIELFPKHFYEDIQKYSIEELLPRQPISLSSTIALTALVELMSRIDKFHDKEKITFSWGTNNDTILIKMPLDVWTIARPLVDDYSWILKPQIFDDIKYNVDNGYTPSGMDYKLMVKHFLEEQDNDDDDNDDNGNIDLNNDDGMKVGVLNISDSTGLRHAITLRRKKVQLYDQDEIDQINTLPLTLTTSLSQYANSALDSYVSLLSHRNEPKLHLDEKQKNLYYTRKGYDNRSSIRRRDAITTTDGIVFYTDEPFKVPHRTKKNTKNKVITFSSGLNEYDDDDDDDDDEYDDDDDDDDTDEYPTLNERIQAARDAKIKAEYDQLSKLSAYELSLHITNENNTINNCMKYLDPFSSLYDTTHALNFDKETERHYNMSLKEKAEYATKNKKLLRLLENNDDAQIMVQSAIASIYTKKLLGPDVSNTINTLNKLKSIDNEILRRHNIRELSKNPHNGNNIDFFGDHLIHNLPKGALNSLDVLDDNKDYLLQRIKELKLLDDDSSTVRLFKLREKERIKDKLYNMGYTTSGKSIPKHKRMKKKPTREPLFHQKEPLLELDPDMQKGLSTRQNGSNSIDATTIPQYAKKSPPPNPHKSPTLEEADDFWSKNTYKPDEDKVHIEEIKRTGVSSSSTVVTPQISTNSDPKIQPFRPKIITPPDYEAAMIASGELAKQEEFDERIQSIEDAGIDLEMDQAALTFQIEEIANKKNKTKQNKTSISSSAVASTLTSSQYNKNNNNSNILTQGSLNDGVASKSTLITSPKEIASDHDYDGYTYNDDNRHNYNDNTYNDYDADDYDHDDDDDDYDDHYNYDDDDDDEELSEDEAQFVLKMRKDLEEGTILDDLSIFDGIDISKLTPETLTHPSAAHILAEYGPIKRALNPEAKPIDDLTHEDQRMLAMARSPEAAEKYLTRGDPRKMEELYIKKEQLRNVVHDRHVYDESQAYERQTQYQQENKELRERLASIEKHITELGETHYKTLVLSKLSKLPTLLNASIDLPDDDPNKFPTGWSMDNVNMHIFYLNPSRIIAHLEAWLNTDQDIDINLDFPLANTSLEVSHVKTNGDLVLGSQQILSSRDDSWLLSNLPARYHKQFQHMTGFQLSSGGRTPEEMAQARIYDQRRAVQLRDTKALKHFFNEQARAEKRQIRNAYKSLYPNTKSKQRKLAGIQLARKSFGHGYNKDDDNDMNPFDDDYGMDNNNDDDDDDALDDDITTMPGNTINPNIKTREFKYEQQRKMLALSKKLDSKEPIDYKDQLAHEASIKYQHELDQRQERLEMQEMNAEIQQQMYAENKWKKLAARDDIIITIKDPLLSSAIMRSYIGKRSVIPYLTDNLQQQWVTFEADAVTSALEYLSRYHAQERDSLYRSTSLDYNNNVNPYSMTGRGQPDASKNQQGKQQQKPSVHDYQAVIPQFDMDDSPTQYYNDQVEAVSHEIRHELMKQRRLY